MKKVRTQTFGREYELSWSELKNAVMQYMDEQGKPIMDEDFILEVKDLDGATIKVVDNVEEEEIEL